MKIDVKPRLAALKRLVEGIPSLKINARVQVYVTVKVLATELGEIAERIIDLHPYVIEEDIERLLESCRALARLESGYGNNDDQLLEWAQQAIQSMESADGFDAS